MIHTCMHRRRELLAALARSCEGVCGAMSFFVLSKTENKNKTEQKKSTASQIYIYKEKRCSLTYMITNNSCLHTYVNH